MLTGFKTQDARRWHAKKMNRLFEARNIVRVFIFLVSTTAAVAANGAGQTPQDAVQPTSERLDLGMYSRIRTEGLQHSRISCQMPRRNRVCSLHLLPISYEYLSSWLFAR